MGIYFIYRYFDDDSLGGGQLVHRRGDGDEWLLEWVGVRDLSILDMNCQRCGLREESKDVRRA